LEIKIFLQKIPKKERTRKNSGANPTIMSYNASAVKKSHTTPKVAQCVLKTKILSTS
jgi:hypothetical protein